MTGTLADKLEDVDAQQRAGVAIEPRQKTVRDLVADMEPQFRRALPQHVDAARFTRLALTALRTTPKLAECSGESVLAGLMQAAQLGLEIDAIRGQAYLIPRWNNRTRRNEASFQLGYKGLIDLAGRGGITVRAREVCENDLFEFEDGLDPKLRHIPELRKERGAAWAYFAVATFPDREEREFLVMSRAEAERHRDKFASTKNRQGAITGPWVDHFDAMARKSCIIKLLGQLPLPVEVVEALALEDVPMDVVPVEQREIAPADPADSTGSTETSVEESAAEQGSGSPPDAAVGGTRAHPENGPTAETPPSQDPDDPDRRKLAAYLLDEARKADHDGVTKWLAGQGMPNDSRKWTAEQITTVIDWITAEPDQEATQ